MFRTALLHLDELDLDDLTIIACISVRKTGRKQIEAELPAFLAKLEEIVLNRPWQENSNEFCRLLMLLNIFCGPSSGYDKTTKSYTRKAVASETLWNLLFARFKDYILKNPQDFNMDKLLRYNFDYSLSIGLASH